MFLLDDLIMSPWRFFLFIAKEINNKVLAELTDESTITRRLLEAQVQHEMGEIDDQEYNQIETELIARLHTAREWKLQLAEEAEAAEQEEAGYLEDFETTEAGPGDF